MAHALYPTLHQKFPGEHPLLIIHKPSPPSASGMPLLPTSPPHPFSIFFLLIDLH